MTRKAAVSGIARIPPNNPPSKVVPTITAMMMVTGCSPTRPPIIRGEMISPSSVCTMANTISTNRGWAQSPKFTAAIMRAVRQIVIAPRKGMMVNTMAAAPINSAYGNPIRRKPMP